MRVLVIGDGHSQIHEVAVANALKSLDHEVRSLFWHSYFEESNVVRRIFKRIQNKFLIGPAIKDINQDIVKEAIKFKPNLIFIYRGTHVYHDTISSLKALMPGCFIFGYNNDDPFSKGHSPFLWRHFLRSIPKYDLMFAYRRHNIKDYLNNGAVASKILMPWFIPGKDEPLNVPIRNDVIFVGHYENDARLNYLETLSKTSYDFKLFGPDWDKAPDLPFIAKYRPIIPLVGNKYREEICASRIALCFLSTLNRDEYTRRCFEIPAMKVFMLCQYSEELANIFREDIDVVFFRNPKEMINKIKFYLDHTDIRNKIAESGYQRIISGGHDIVSRMRYVCNFIN